jgi:hypothetical protein
MLILYGTRRFGLKKIGARKDFCNACERECVAEQWQSFDWGHIFFVPILPLGMRERWRCSLCGSDPRARYKTGKFMRIIGLFVLPVLFVPLWFDHSPAPPGRPSDASAAYGMTLIFGGIWLWLLYTTFKRSSGSPNEARRASVAPLSLDTCLYCRRPLVLQPHPHCPSCNIRFYAEPQQLPPSLSPA